MLQEIEDDGQGFFIRNLERIVDGRALKVCGDAALTDALGDRGAFGFQFASLDPGIDRGTHRVGGGDADVRIARLQRHGDTCQRAAGADGAGEAVHLALRLLPDFGARGFLMRAAVGHIVELVGPDGAAGFGFGKLLGKARGNLHIVVRVLVRHGGHFDQLRAQKTQRILLLLALCLGNDDHGAEAERVRHQREADARIAGGAFDDHAAGLEASSFYRVAHDEQRGAIFHRLAGIHELGLAENFAAGERGGALEANQRGVADGGQNVVLDGHGPALRGASRT